MNSIAQITNKERNKSKGRETERCNTHATFTTIIIIFNMLLLLGLEAEASHRPHFSISQQH